MINIQRHHPVTDDALDGSAKKKTVGRHRANTPFGDGGGRCDKSSLF